MGGAGAGGAGRGGRRERRRRGAGGTGGTGGSAERRLALVSRRDICLAEGREDKSRHTKLVEKGCVLVKSSV
ncbi:unnamed protein product [Coccothraustes coccothraustes]